MSPELPSLKRFQGMLPGEMAADLGVIGSVNRVGTVDNGLDVQGLETDEFDSVASRFAYTVNVAMLTRDGYLRNVPYLFAAIGGGGLNAGIPTVNQQVLLTRVGNKNMPVAIGGLMSWRELRRMIADGIIPELKPGEFIHQASIRSNPMSYFEESSSDNEVATIERFKGARVYGDFKGRLFAESRHIRNGNGSFVQVILGNPAGSQADDEANDFNEKDETTDSYIVMQGRVAESEESTDNLFLFNVTQDGKVVFEFAKGWFGRSPSEEDPTVPETTVEVDTVNKTVILDGSTIKAGRSASEKAVKGDSLVNELESLIDFIINLRQPGSSVGTTGPPTNTAQLLALKPRLRAALSNTNLVE